MTSQRAGIIWPLLILIIAVLWLMESLGVLPGSLIELITRAWPVALVALGLALLLGRRVRFGNVISLVLAAVLVGGTMSVAVSQQSGRVVTENQKTFAQPIDSSVTTVNVVVNTLNTEIAIVPGTLVSPTINVDFAGSKQSIVTSDFKTDGPTGTFTFSETLDSAIPSLSGLGRGKVTLSLPVGATVQQLNLTVTGSGGDITLDGTGTALNMVSVTTKGKVAVTALPQTMTALTINAAGDLDLGATAPTLTALNVNSTDGKLTFDATKSALKNMTLSITSLEAKLPQQNGLIGDIKATGDVTVTIPATIAANIRLLGNAANNAEFNQSDYIMNIDKVLVSRRSSEPQMQLKIDASGKTTIQ